MILKYYGHACYSMSFSDGTVLVIDPFDESITYRPCTVACDAALLSHQHHDHNHIETLSGDFAVIDTAGDFKVGNTSISAMRSFHDHHNGAHRGLNLMFRIEGDGISVAHLGDLGHIPNDKQIAFLRNLDVLLIPVGGHYTIDHIEAFEVIRKLQPRIAIAMHYRTEDNPGFDAQDCTPFIRAAGAKAMPNSIDLKPDTINSIPNCIYMAYK